MIINEKDAAARLNSPLNLINKLQERKNGSAMSLFTGNKNGDSKPRPFLQPVAQTAEEAKPFINPFEKKAVPQQSLIPAIPLVLPQIEPALAEPSLDKLLDNADVNIKLGLAHDKAVNLLHESLEKLSDKLDQVKADKLPSVIAAASKTVESIRRERNEAAKTGKDREVHYHFYTPIQRKVSDYEIIEVQGLPAEENSQSPPS